MTKDISSVEKINQLNNKEYKKLSQFIQALHSTDADKKLSQLVNIFDSVAMEYRRKANELIAQEKDLVAQRYAHNQINARIRDHVSLLSNVFQRYPPVALGP